MTSGTAANLEVLAIANGFQYGYTQATSASNLVAARWSGTSGSYTSLAPAGSTSSLISSADSNFGYGSASVGGTWGATRWNFADGSTTRLHDPTWSASEILRTGSIGQVGSVTNGAGTHAALWVNSTYSSLAPAGATASRAHGISGNAQVGSATIGGVQQAALWRGSAASFLSLHPSGATSSLISDIAGDYAVGFAVFGGAPEACLWQVSTGQLTRLNQVLGGNVTAVTVQLQGTSLTVGGQFNSQPAIFTTVVPEPTSLVSFAAALLLLRRPKKN